MSTPEILFVVMVALSFIVAVGGLYLAKYERHQGVRYIGLFLALASLPFLFAAASVLPNKVG